MDDSIKQDKAYLKCKLIVKTWEKDFKLKNLRTPSKFDIKEAPSKIKHAYKKYFNIKSAALDNSLNMYDFEEDLICSPEPMQSLDNIASDVLSPETDNIMQTLPNGQELEELILNAKSKETTKMREKVQPLSPFTNNLSKKLFKSKTFAIRNPRKLSLNKSQQSQDTLDNCNISNVDTIQVNLCEATNLDNPNNFDYSASTVMLQDNMRIRKINEAWIERATTNYNILKTTGFKEQMNIETSMTTERPYDYVENSESDSENTNISKIKPALKKRKISETKSIISTCDKNEGSSKLSKTKKVLSSNLSKNDTKCSIESECFPDISEYLPFGLERDVIPRHADISSVLKDIENRKTNTISDKCKGDINMPDAEKLVKKIENGTLNENFVKINIEKKVFVRGKKNMNFSKYKKQQWKDKKALHAGMEFPESGKNLCFKCGLSGHMARYCIAHKGDTLLPLSDCNENDNIPTLQDMETIAFSAKEQPTSPGKLLQNLYKPSPIPDSFLKILAHIPCYSDESNNEIKPVYPYPQHETDELLTVLAKFGHISFRPGQEQTIKRILSGMSTLLVLSTGEGKSLCYQIPAYIYRQHYKCITLVISPLVSLMEDQVISMPDFLKAGCLHTNQTLTQRQKLMQCIKDGELNILLISPEALISGDTSSGFSKLFKSLPPIAFACIDEVHCVSQWSHNFRPSYLMICRVLREKLNVKCILGLTATASQSTIKSIIEHLNISDGLSGVITNPNLPSNLYLSVSLEKDKDQALISFLLSKQLSAYNSIIIYCIRRDECERIAAILRSALQEPGKKCMESNSKKRKKMSYIAEAYHAGMSSAQRKKIQKHFMDGTVRIIVATVAFGMGINKSDIRCIIHYNMPSSFESYVQEVGRAGRDGKPAHCHVLINKTSNDKNELLKHIHANTIERPAIRKLIKKIFIPCECYKNTDIQILCDNANRSRCKGHEVGIPIDETMEELDVASENIATLLCYLELHPNKYIKVLNNSYTKCRIMSYGGPQKILEAAKTCPPLAMAYLIESKNNANVMKTNVLEFQVIEVASAVGWDSGIVKYHLKNLEWVTKNGMTKRSQLKVEFNTLGFRIKSPGDLTPSELDSMLDDLHGCVLSQEKTKLYQLEEISKAFTKLGNYSLNEINFNHNEDFVLKKSQELKLIIRNYFQRDNIIDSVIELEERPLDEERVIADVRSLIVSYKDCNFTGRSIARIFQGISSPNYPAIVWGKCKFWRSHLHEDFYGLIRIATQQLILMK